MILPSFLPSRPVCEGSRRRLQGRTKLTYLLALRFTLLTCLLACLVALPNCFTQLAQLCFICVRFMVCLVCFPQAGLRRLHLACSLAKLASLVRTMLGLLDLRRLRLPRSLAMLASLVQTIVGLLGLRGRRLARSLVELAKSRFCINFRKIVRKTTDTYKEIYFQYDFLKTVLQMGILKFFWEDPNLTKLLNS